MAAQRADRHVTSAYRLRARDPDFARAWDAARRMAYSRLRDEAIERAIDGTSQQVWRDGEWIGMKRVKSDRLLMAMFEHLRHEPVPNAMAPRSVDQVEDRRSNAIGVELGALAPPSAGLDDAPETNPASASS